ncbi:MAG: DUF4286 family protein [Cytophagales bacterium]|nr:DUF4286 family protein [Cytophagales bacterium]
MILYNVTVSIDEDIEYEWREWMKEVHIPEVIETGFFLRYRMLKLLNEQPDATGITYAIQYELENIGKLDTYLEHHAPTLQKKHQHKYGNKCLSFRTVLEEV